MDIHKPKPWHSAREFLKEYLIIVIGVLTALTAEAGVEWLHWRHLAEQHEEDLRANGQYVAVNAIQRVAIDGCLSDTLKATADALRRPEPQWKGLNPGASGRVETLLPANLTSASQPWPTYAWESTLGDGSVSHIPADRVHVYAFLFGTAHQLGLQQEQLADLLPELTPLAFDQTLTSQDKQRYLGIIARAGRTETLMRGMSRTILALAATNGMWPTKDVVTPRMDTSRKSRGACVQDVDRAAYEAGGAFALPPLFGNR